MLLIIRTWCIAHPLPAVTMGWKAKDVNTEETDKKHNLKICPPTIRVHVVGGNVPRDSFLLKLTFSDWISAHGRVKSGVSIDHQGGVLMQILQRSMADSDVISFEIARKWQLPSPRTLSRMCGAISSQHKGLTQAGVERLLRTVLWQYAIRIWIASSFHSSGGVADQYFHQAVGK